jgi:hypothetical protein
MCHHAWHHLSFQTDFFLRIPISVTENIIHPVVLKLLVVSELFHFFGAWDQTQLQTMCGGSHPQS